MNAPTPVSPTTHPFDPRSWEVTRGDAASRALSIVLALMCVAAVYGGIGLMRNGMGMPMHDLDGTPFSSWTLPGVALLLFVAVPQGVAAAMVAVAHRWAALVAIVAGAGLVAWIGVEILWIGEYFFLQPVVVIFGLVEIGLAAWWAGEGGTA